MYVSKLLRELDQFSGKAVIKLVTNKQTYKIKEIKSPKFIKPFNMGWDKEVIILIVAEEKEIKKEKMEVRVISHLNYKIDANTLDEAKKIILNTSDSELDISRESFEFVDDIQEE